MEVKVVVDQTSFFSSEDFQHPESNKNPGPGASNPTCPNEDILVFCYFFVAGIILARNLLNLFVFIYQKT